MSALVTAKFFACFLFPLGLLVSLLIMWTLHRSRKREKITENVSWFFLFDHIMCVNDTNKYNIVIMNTIADRIDRSQLESRAVGR